MDGSGNSLVMEPPDIIIASNYELNYEILSENRWNIYERKSNTYNIEKIIMK